jgi:hypothetical protein
VSAAVPKKKKIPTSRPCAICGEGQSSARGGCLNYATALRRFRESGGVVLVPTSDYMHVGCAGALRGTK